MLTKREVIERYLPANIQFKEASSFAPSNIALCKYWGKREKELNLPINSSLSVSLNHLGTTTTLKAADANQVSLNGQVLAEDSAFAQKVFEFVDFFRGGDTTPIQVVTENNIPTAAGLASSASGFAALTLAVDKAFGLELPSQVLSAFARMGSGSACRSLFHGFVEWEMGCQADGMDSCAVPLEAQWPDLRVGLVKVATGQKSVDSRSGMKRTIETAHLYQSWPIQASSDLQKLHQAIAARDFEGLGATAEHNAMSMHATMIASWPPLVYWQPESLAAMQTVWALRSDGVPVYLTMDAGPNLKLLFLADQQVDIEAAFPDLEVVAPFDNPPVIG
jgi:diphosphomevalonate decarboxylase